jgi:hypothetical protein
MAAVILAASAAAAEDPPGLAWELIYPGYSGDFKHVIQTTDGRYAVAGYFHTGYSGIHCVILFQPDGEVQWVWHGVTSGVTAVNWVEQDSDGTLLTTGVKHAGNDYVLMLARLSLGGGTFWFKQYTELGDARGMCVAVLPDGRIAVGGRLSPVSDYEPMVTLATSTGDRLWTVTYGACSGTVTRLLARGGEILAFIDRLNGCPLVAAYDYSGQLQRIWDFTGIMPSDEGDICSTTEGDGYGLVAGTDLARLGSGGDIIWQCMPPGSDERTLVAIEPAFDGGFVMCGGTGMYYDDERDYHFYDGWLVRTDGAGQTLWWLADSSSFGNTFYRSVTQLDQGGYAVAGYRTLEDGQKHALLRILQPETGMEAAPGEGGPSIRPIRNPCTGIVELEFCGFGVGEVTVRAYDISGRLVGTGTAEGQGSGAEQIEMTAPPRGAYVVRADRGPLSASTRLIVL